MNENGHFQIDEQTWQLLLDKIESVHDDVKATKQQATMTNGRVSALEQWKSWMTGAMALIGMSVPVVGFFLYEAFKHIWGGKP